MSRSLDIEAQSGECHNSVVFYLGRQLNFCLYKFGIRDREVYVAEHDSQVQILGTEIESMEEIPNVCFD